jgi:Na+-driven multidrug efflux pump
MFSLLAAAPAGILELTLFSEQRLAQTSLMRAVQFGFDLLVSLGCITWWGVAGAFIARFFSGAMRTLLVTIFYLKNRREAQA